jgi:hypothetical protein
MQSDPRVEPAMRNGTELNISPFNNVIKKVALPA